MLACLHTYMLPSPHLTWLLAGPYSSLGGDGVSTNLNYVGGALQGWNKFCYTGGVQAMGGGGGGVGGSAVL